MSHFIYFLHRTRAHLLAWGWTDYVGVHRTVLQENANQMGRLAWFFRTLIMNHSFLMFLDSCNLMKQPLKILTSSWSSMHWWAIRHGVQMSQTSPVPALDECFLRWAFRIKGHQWLSRLRSPDGGDGQNPQGGEVTWGHEKWAKSYHQIFQKIVSPQPWASRNLEARIGVFIPLEISSTKWEGTCPA